jgi:hypothetical protein
MRRNHKHETYTPLTSYTLTRTRQGCRTGPHGDRTCGCAVNSPHNRTCGAASLVPVLAARLPHVHRTCGCVVNLPHNRTCGAASLRVPAAAITMPRGVEVGSGADVTPVEDGKDGLYSAYSEQFSVYRSRSNFGRHPPVQYDSKKCASTSTVFLAEVHILPSSRIPSP